MPEAFTDVFKLNAGQYTQQYGGYNPNITQTIAPKAGMTLTGQGSATGISGGTPNLGIGDITKAQEGAQLLKDRYIDKDPYAQYLQSARTGTMAMLGRQSEIDRTQLEAGLNRMGAGVNALRRTGARATLNTEIAYRYMGAEKGLAELGMATADRALGAINDYIGAYLNIAGRQQGAYQSYWQRYSSNNSTIRAGGRGTESNAKPVREGGFDIGQVGTTGGFGRTQAGAGLSQDTSRRIGY